MQVPFGEGECDDARRGRLNRMRWHCRRALLELDLVFQRFWAQSGEDIDAATESALTRLLALEDHELWDLVSGRESTADPELDRVLKTLRQLGVASKRQAGINTL